MTDAALWLPALSEAALRARFGSSVLERGRPLVVGPCSTSSDGALQRVQARVVGSRPLHPYRSELRLAPGSSLRGACDCRHASGGAACKHQAALALAWRAELAGNAPRDVANADAARLVVEQLFDALPDDAPATRLDRLLPLLQAWRATQAEWALAGAEQAMLRLGVRLNALQAERGWADGEAAWQALAAALADELYAAWAQLGPRPAGYAERYLALLAADQPGRLGLIAPSRALPLLGEALTRRAGELLRLAWEQGADADSYLAHLLACGDIAERLRVLADSRRDAAGHAAYIAALLEAGRGREALAAAEIARRRWPDDRALETQLIVLYEQDGWDEQALALRRAAFAREPSSVAYAELLRLSPDAPAEALHLQDLMARTAAGRRLRLQLWTDQAEWPAGLAWLRQRPALDAALLDACGDWLCQLPPAHDAEAAELLKELLQRSLPGARPPYAREQRWVAEICRRLAPAAARLWLAWLRVEQRQRRDFLAALPASPDNRRP